MVLGGAFWGALGDGAAGQVGWHRGCSMAPHLEGRRGGHTLNPKPLARHSPLTSPYLPCLY